MKKLFLNTIPILFFFLIFNSGYSQNVGIGAESFTPDESAGLEIRFTDKGLLPPRLTTIQRDMILNPASGLVIYNNDTECIEFYNSQGWNSVCAQQSVNCSVLIQGDDEYCEGETIQLYSLPSGQLPFQYTWSGPNSFNSTVQHPLILNSVSVSSGLYFVTVTDANGCNALGMKEITVLPELNASISIQANPSNQICVGNTVTYQATPVNAQPTSVLQWYVNGQPIGTNSLIFSSSSIEDGDIVHCEMTVDGCATINPVVSNSIEMEVSEGPAVSINLPLTYNGRVVYNYTGSLQTFTVPPCVFQIYVKMWGAGGGGGFWAAGGSGAYVGGFMTVVPGSQIHLLVGQGGCLNGSTTFGGGGAAGSSSNSWGYKAASGGGRTTLQLVIGSDYVTVGGGGGAGVGTGNQPFGGGGGAPIGNDGGSNASGTLGVGRGATTMAGGEPSTGGSVNSVAGSALQGSSGASSAMGGGGGGGGFYGGSGGSGNTSGGASVIGGGGGGSSFTNNLTSVVNLVGTNGGYNLNIAPNSTDGDYVSGIGAGAAHSTCGGNGQVVIYW